MEVSVVTQLCIFASAALQTLLVNNLRLTYVELLNKNTDKDPVSRG